MWWSSLLAACGGPEPAPPGTTAGAPCPDGAASVVAGPEVAVGRWVDGTTVTTCADGPHAEDWPGGGPAARGQRAGGERTGTWTRWTPDGRFDGSVTYGPGGVVVGRTEPSPDGALLELELAAGRVVGWHTAPASPQPEWTDGVLAPGTRWAP
jgi:hypothetical protein